MDFPTIGGLPAHPLIVHATVVTLGTAALAVILVPLSTSSGEQLEHEVPHTALVEQHTRLADGLLPWVLGLLVVAVLLAVRDVMAQDSRGRVRVPDGAATTVAAASHPAGGPGGPGRPRRRGHHPAGGPHRPLRRQGLVEPRSVHSEALTPSAGGCP